MVSALGLLTACGGGSTNSSEAPSSENNKAIASIKEASQICYSSAKNKLFVVSDKGILYEF